MLIACLGACVPALCRMAKKLNRSQKKRRLRGKKAANEIQKKKANKDKQQGLKI